MARFKVCLLILLTVFTQGSLSAKLNVPRVLIPLISSVQVNFTLEVTDGGCYKWSSSRDDVVSVRALGGECSHSALVWSATHVPHRNSAIILAEDVRTEQVLRCDVIVDSIVSLELVTTTRELYVEEAPEAFEIRAYDDQGNEFTTLDGVEFQWTLVSPLKDNDVIRIMSFSSSSYEASAALQALEAAGKRGHTALIEGVKTGSAKVMVRLAGGGAAGGVEVALRVVANLLLAPPEARLLPGDALALRMLQVREGRLAELPQPDPQYSLHIDDPRIATIDPRTGVVTAVSVGSSRVWLRDAGEGAGEGEGGRPPEAALRVVRPTRLRLQPRPSAALLAQPCALHVSILDSEERQVTVGPHTRVHVEVDESMLRVDWRSTNGTVVRATALRSGVATVTATLVSVAGQAIYPKITASGQVDIYRKLEIIPPEVVLPWDPSSSSRASYTLRATGGDGTYAWRVEGAACAGVGPHGTLTALALGRCAVTAYLPAHPHIAATASVRVVEAARLEVAWSAGEAPVRAPLALHLALFPAGEGAPPFTSCGQLPFQVSTLEGVDFQRMEPDPKPEDVQLFGSACGVVWVQCGEAGAARVRVGVGELTRDVALACHAPLTRLHPPRDPLLLTVGSTANVIYSGGPLSWTGGAEPRYEARVADQDAAWARALPTSAQHLHVYTVACLKLGKTEMTLKVYGDKSGAVLGEAQLGVSCSSPHSLAISQSQPPDSACPLAEASQVAILRGDSSLELEVRVLDAAGQEFHNASSLQLGWSSRPSGLVGELGPRRLLAHASDDFLPVPTVAYHSQSLSINTQDLPEPGAAELLAEVYGYDNAVLRSVGARHTPPLPSSPRAALSIKVVRPLRIETDKLVVYLSSGVEARVALAHGSGHAVLSAASGEVARVALEGLPARALRVRPLRAGQFTVTVRDPCLRASPAALSVRVLGALTLGAELPPLLERGRSASVRVCLQDAAGACLPAATVGAPPIAAQTGPGLKVAPDPATPAGASLMVTVTGLEEGPAELHLSAGDVRGVAHTHVFLPLQLVPRDTVLLVGGSLELRTQGGPPHPAAVTFALAESSPEGVVKTLVNGVVEALSAGTGVVEARAHANGALLGRATATVRVRRLEGVAIHAPVPALLAGNTMPLWATGVSEGIGPAELGALQPALAFSWSVRGDGAATVTDVLAHPGLEPDDTDRASVRLTAVRPGKVTVYLNVTQVGGGGVAGRSLSWGAQRELQVLLPLELVAPSSGAGPLAPLLLAPHSSATLRTNYPTDQVTFRVWEDESAASGALVDVSPGGEVRAHGREGRALLAANVGAPAQRLALAVQVCAAHYATLRLEGLGALSGPGALPQGLRVRASATLHDALGRPLASAPAQLTARTPRADLAHVDHQLNTSLEIVLAQSGRTVLEVTGSVGDVTFSDYVSLRILPAVYPLKVTATVGDVWCVRSGVRSARWSSSQARALHASAAGRLQARSPAPACAAQLAAPGLALHAACEVRTRAAERAAFLAPPERELVLTDLRPLDVPLVLAAADEKDKTSNVLFGGGECLSVDAEDGEEPLPDPPFSCELRPPGDDLAAEPALDIVKGTWVCRVSWSGVAGFNSSVALLAHAGALSAGPLPLRLLRGARAEPPALRLAPPPALAAELRVRAPAPVLRQLLVTPSSAALTVEGPAQDGNDTYLYIVRAAAQGTITGHIRILSELTDQDIQVEVTGGAQEGACARGGASPLLTLLQDQLPALLALVACAAALAGTVLVYGSYIQPLLKPGPIPVQAPSPGTPLQVLGTPPRGSPYAAVRPSPGSVYGDPSFLSSPERRRNPRFL